MSHDHRQPAPRSQDGARGLFPTFFMAGFECSTFIWKDGERKDYVRLTAHDRHLKEDYQRTREMGIAVVREAIRWPLVDRGNGHYDWSTLDPVIDAAGECGITVIWDLCHYGFPDGCDPLTDACRPRFTDYCRAATERVTGRRPPPRFFTPINEITFFSGAATDMGWMYPFAKGRYTEMKRALCHMAIEGVKAIREVDAEARMVHVDPIIHAVPPKDRPDLADEAHKEAYDTAYEAWDMLYGRLHPELGGAPEILDIVGVNTYFFSQAEIAMGGERKVLGPRDPRRKPLSELLLYAWERYHRPVIIGETAGYQDERANWLRMTVEESMKALLSGVDLQGICLYPCVDIPDWNTGEWAKIGLFDLEDKETLARCPCDPYIEELRRWTEILDQPRSLDSREAWARRETGVQLSEVRRHAEEWAAKTPGAVKEREKVAQAP